MLGKQHVSHGPTHLSVYRNELAEVTPDGLTLRHCGIPTTSNARALKEWIKHYGYPFAVHNSIGRITVKDIRTNRTEALTTEGVTFPLTGGVWGDDGH